MKYTFLKIVLLEKNFDSDGKNKNLNDVQDDEIILDIGVNTIKNIKKRLINQIQFYGTDLLDILKIVTFRKALYPLQKIYLKILFKNL